MLFDTVAEYDDEIERVRSSIKRSLLIGEHSKNVTGTTERSNTEINFEYAQAYLTRLIRERALLSDNLTTRPIGVGW